jgi:hypothetical protein
VPKLAHREDAVAAVLRISRRGRRRGCCGRGKIVMNAYVDCNGRQRNARRERLPLAALATVLSGGMEDAARALTASSSSSPDDANGGAPWLWKLFADQLCRRLFLSICLHGDVPVLPSFACLPVDLQMTILCRLHVAEDVARLECASKELRRLVADHDALLWKAKYDESVGSLNSIREQPVEFRPPPIVAIKEPPYFTDEDMALMSWKERYAMTRWQTMLMTTWRFGMTPMATWRPRVPPAKRARLQTIIDMVRRRAQRNSPQHHDRPADQPRTVARTSSDHGWRGTTVDDRSSRRRMMATVVLSKPYRKGNGAGAVHSPSSRHRWNHR